MTKADYTEIRFDLFKESFVGAELKKTVKKLLKERTKNLKEEKDLIAHYTRHTRELALLPEIEKLAKKLKFEYKAFGWFLLENSNITMNMPKRMTKVASKSFPITEQGFYIKIERDTKKEDVKKTMDYIKQELLPVAETVFGFEQTKLRRSQIPNDDYKKIQIYIQIEKEIKHVYSEKDHQTDMEIADEDPLVYLAIQYVAMNLIEDRDYKFDERLVIKTTELQQIYYDVTTRYELPTAKKLNRLLNILES